MSNNNQCDGLDGKGNVYAIRRGSRQDGPGTRTVVLFKGCSFSCWWCPNPELQSPAQELRIKEGQCIRCGRCISICTTDAVREDSVREGAVREDTVREDAVREGAVREDAVREDAVPPANKQYATNREFCIVCGACISGCEGHARELVGRCMTVDEVMAQVLEDLPLYEQTGGGVTFAGGEPLMQSDFLYDLLRACKSYGIHTVVDTSAYTPWEFLDRIRGMVDLFSVDLKLMDEERHRQFTGLPNGLILENLEMLARAGQRLALRVPVIPGISDDGENMRAVVRFASRLANLESVELVSYRPAAKERYDCLGRSFPITTTLEPGEKQMDRLLDMFRSSGLPAVISGTDQPEPTV